MYPRRRVIGKRGRPAVLTHRRDLGRTQIRVEAQAGEPGTDGAQDHDAQFTVHGADDRRMHRGMAIGDGRHEAGFGIG